jgi:hypothetical protein
VLSLTSPDKTRLAKHDNSPIISGLTDFEKSVVDAVRFRVSNTLRTSKPGDNTEAIARGTLAHSEGISEETVKDITAEVQRICVNARKAGDTSYPEWPSEWQARYERHLRNRDWTEWRGDRMGDILQEVTDQSKLSGDPKRASTKHSKFTEFMKLLAEYPGTPDEQMYKVFLKFIERSNLQPNNKNKSRTHHQMCKFLLNGVCSHLLSEEDPSHTDCPLQKAHGTLVNEVSMVSSHPKATPAMQAAAKHSQVKTVLDAIRRLQAGCGRKALTGYLYSLDEIRAVMCGLDDEIEELEELGEANQLPIIDLLAAKALLATMMDFSKRATEALLVELGRLQIRVTEPAKMQVACIEMVHQKVIAPSANPSAFSMLDDQDPFASFRCIADLGNKYDELAIKEDMHAKFVFEQMCYDPVEGTYSTALVSDKRKTATYSAAYLQPLLTKAARRREVHIEGKEFPLKSVRIARTRTGCAAGLSEKKIEQDDELET